MNSFERFQITHLSPSSLNLWRSAPGLWSVRYIAGIKDEGNSAMWRGTAVEDGLVALIRTKDMNLAIENAYRSFDENSHGVIDAERDLIEPMLRQSLHWAPPSPLVATQIKVEHYFDPIPIPVIGYLDLAFESGIDIDLKTTKAIPSEPRPDHVRQVSLYRAARERQGGLLYLSGKRHAYYPVGDAIMGEALEELRDAALSLNNFLSRCDSKADAIKSLPIDWDAWNAPKTRIPMSELIGG